MYGRNQTDDEKAVSGKIEEMARMDNDVLLAHQIDGAVFVGAIAGNAQNGVPASFRFEQFISRLARLIDVIIPRDLSGRAREVVSVWNRAVRIRSESPTALVRSRKDRCRR